MLTSLMHLIKYLFLLKEVIDLYGVENWSITASLTVAVSSFLQFTTQVARIKVKVKSLIKNFKLVISYINFIKFNKNFQFEL